MKKSTIIILLWLTGVAASITIIYLARPKTPKNKYTIDVIDNQNNTSSISIKAYTEPVLKDSKIYADDNLIMDSVKSFSTREVHGYLQVPDQYK